MRTLMMVALLVAGGAQAQERENVPGAKSGTKCNTSKDCALGLICAATTSICVIGCTGDHDCKVPRVCSPMRACKDRADCKKVCHLPDLMQ